MKQFLLVIVTAATIMSVWPQTITGQAGKARTIKEIDALARSIQVIVDGKKQPDLIFADTADVDATSGKWRKFASMGALETFREETETYSIAYNWKAKGRLVASNFTLFSPSGDWSKYVMHFFRRDGSAAMVTSELRTFYGHFIAFRTEYFDASGKRLKVGTKYMDLSTRTPKKPTQEMLADNPAFYAVDRFKRVRDLPFSRLLD